MTGVVRARQATLRWRFQATRAPVCGNGVREGDEECDDATACCAGCRLVDGPSCTSVACTSGDDCAAGAYCVHDQGCGGTGSCRLQPEACVGVLEPACGCDGRTYVNACEAARAGVEVVYPGACRRRCGTIAGLECPPDTFCEFRPGTCGVADAAGVCLPSPTDCPGTEQPVCGCNGDTFTNDCTRRAAGVPKAHDGRCQCPGPPPCRFGTLPVDTDGDGCLDSCRPACELPCCLVNEDCAATEYCAREVGRCEGPGTCRARPVACTQVYDPVCGCDGTTYGSPCGAEAAGVGVATPGPCALRCGTIAGLGCPDGQFCDLDPGQCHTADAAGVCRPDLKGVLCIDLYLPVCGCDGVTYGNECERLRSQAQKAHDGACCPVAIICAPGTMPVDRDGDGCVDGCAPACRTACDCYTQALNIPCPLLCPGCGSFWACEAGGCIPRCGVLPPDLRDLLAAGACPPA